MPEVTLVEAVNLALARAMEDDPGVLVLGEDVGVDGGVFRATVGLQKRFGSERVLDTPLAELLISGLCVGMAVQGLKPVGEIQFMGFLYPCLDQLVNHHPACAIAPRDGSPVPWSCALRMGPAFARPSMIRKARRRCSPIFLACAS